MSYAHPTRAERLARAAAYAKRWERIEQIGEDNRRVRAGGSTETYTRGPVMSDDTWQARMNPDVAGRKARSVIRLDEANH